MNRISILITAIMKLMRTKIVTYDHEHEKNIIEKGIELWKEAERERDRNVLENKVREELKQNDEDTFIKLADFGIAGFIGRDERLRRRCGTPGKMKTIKHYHSLYF